MFVSSRKVKEVLNKLDGRKMDDNEKEVIQTKIIVVGVVVLLSMLMICITTYYCIDRLHPLDRMSIVKQIVDSM